MPRRGCHPRIPARPADDDPTAGLLGHARGADTEENAKNSELKKKKLLCVPLEAVRLKAVRPALEAVRLKELVCLPIQEAQAATMGPQPLCRGASPISSNEKEGHGPTLAVDCQPIPVGPAVTLAARCVH